MHNLCAMSAVLPDTSPCHLLCCVIEALLLLMLLSTRCLVEARTLQRGWQKLTCNTCRSGLADSTAGFRSHPDLVLVLMLVLMLMLMPCLCGPAAVLPLITGTPKSYPPQ